MRVRWREHSRGKYPERDSRVEFMRKLKTRQRVSAECSQNHRAESGITATIALVKRSARRTLDECFLVVNEGRAKSNQRGGTLK